MKSEMLGFTNSTLARSWGVPASMGQDSISVTQCFLLPAEAVSNPPWDVTVDTPPHYPPAPKS